MTGLAQKDPVQGVVLLHGIARTARSMNTLQRVLQGSGFATLNLDYPSRKQPLAALASNIHAKISAFARTIDGPVHFVGHSMGGLVARVFIATHRPDRLGRVVMLGTPNGGSEVADVLRDFWMYRAFCGPAGQQLTTAGDETLRLLPPVDYPLGVIAGRRSIDPVSSFFILPRPNDGKVAVVSTLIDGMADHIVVAASHPRLTHHPLAIAETIAFLRQGRFNKAEGQF